jgi:hypothetical protein
MSDNLFNKLDEIENKIILLIMEYEKLMIEYENNCKLLDKFIPKVGQKRKRWQTI